MNKAFSFIVCGACWMAVVILAGCRPSARQSAVEGRFVIDRLNPYTPVKDQGRNQTCWIYAMLATIETEHLGRGDSVNLSPYDAERQLLAEGARQLYLDQGHVPVTCRGMAGRLVRLIGAYGIMPYDAYRYGEGVNATVVARKVGLSVEAAVHSRLGLEACMDRVEALLDDSFGPRPPHVFMLGAQYTPQEFARSVCAPGEYEALTSFTHHPYFGRFVLEVPDNIDRESFLNLPLDSLMRRLTDAVRRGHGVCWEGDISEPGFSFAQGVAVLPQGAAVTPEARQRAFERYQTTDDHCMAIVGLAHDRRGRRYFIMKNSWGTRNPYGGLMYVSEDYVRLKTVAVYLPR